MMTWTRSVWTIISLLLGPGKWGLMVQLLHPMKSKIYFPHKYEINSECIVLFIPSDSFSFASPKLELRVLSLYIYQGTWEVPGSDGFPPTSAQETTLFVWFTKARQLGIRKAGRGHLYKLTNKELHKERERKSNRALCCFLHNSYINRWKLGLRGNAWELDIIHIIVRYKWRI